MNTRFHAPVLALLALLAPACGDSTAEKLDKLATEMCACKDGTCAEGVGKKIKELVTTADKPADDEKSRIEATLKKIDECATKAELDGMMKGG